MRKMGVSEKLSRRIKELYAETKIVMRVKNHSTREFWTVRGVRQGCPLSPTLFNIYMARLEEELRKGHDGGIVVGKRKVCYILRYDIVLMADREEKLKDMMKRFEKFLKEAELEMNAEKTKIVVFEKRRSKKRKRIWK